MNSSWLEAYYPASACNVALSCRCLGMSLNLIEYATNQNFNNTSTRFTFSAKEKDAETGYSYFGSRYYNSDLSIWLSVDPMADKYPSLSPYVYCANNPIKLVDPNGEEWYVNQDGYIKEGDNKDDHTLYAVKGKENTFGDRLTYQRGDRKGQDISMPIDDDVMKSFNTDENGYSKMDLTGKEDAGLNMMRFLSRNTDVEWSFWGGQDKEGNDFATMATSHKKDSDPGSTNPVKNASIKQTSNHQTPLKFFIHSHPRRASWGTWASSNDKRIRDDCKIGSPNAVFGIMHKGVLWDYNNNKLKF